MGVGAVGVARPAPDRHQEVGRPWYLRSRTAGRARTPAGANGCGSGTAAAAPRGSSLRGRSRTGHAAGRDGLQGCHQASGAGSRRSRTRTRRARGRGALGKCRARVAGRSSSRDPRVSSVSAGLAQRWIGIAIVMPRGLVACARSCRFAGVFEISLPIAVPSSLMYSSRPLQFSSGGQSARGSRGARGQVR